MSNPLATFSSRTWTAEELLQGIAVPPSSARRGFPRFIVYVDGVTLQLGTLPALRKTLSNISSKRPKVFVNAGKGVTIDFDAV